MNPILSGYKCILAILGGKKSANFLNILQTLQMDQQDLKFPLCN